MKKTLHLFLLALSLPFLIISCGPDEGCTSKFATNYDKSAIEDCCCTYDVENAISEIIGAYSTDDIDCTIKKDNLNFTIKEDPDIEQGLILTIDERFIIDGEMKGEFVDGEFHFLYLDDTSVCDQRTTLIIKSNNSGIVFDFQNSYLANGSTTNCSLLSYSCNGTLNKI